MSCTVNNDHYISNIMDMLTFFVTRVAGENKVNSQRLNILAEGFYGEFLNLLMGWNLSNANIEQANAPGIDLFYESDDSDNIIVQVSSTYTHKKIQESLDKAKKSRHPNGHFFFVAITTATQNYEGFEIPEGIAFDKDTDILSTSRIEILLSDTSVGIQKLKKLSELVDLYFKRIDQSEEESCLTAPPALADTNSVICRETELEAITNMLQEKKSVLLMSGFGGIGKTALARLVFHTVRWNYDQVAWIPYRQNLKDSLLSNIRLKEDIRDMAVRWQEIEKILNNGLSKLIVIDNADRDEKSGQFPQDDVLLNTITGYPNTTVILTSRLEEIYDYNYYEVGFLSKEACVELFYKHYANDPERVQQDVVRDLAKLAQYHTLTVELIARGARRETNLRAYYAKLQKSFANATRKVRTGHNAKYATIVEHLKVLFDISARTAEEIAVLWDFAVLPAGAALTPEQTELWFQHDPDIPDQLQQDGWLLWIDGHYAMHPLVKEILHLDPIPEHTAEKFLAFVEDEDNGYFSYNDVHTERDRKLALAESVVDAVCREDTLQLAHILDNMGTAYWHAGQYPQAEAHYIRAIAIKKAKLGKDHLSTATTYNNIAGVYRDMGHLNKALEYHEKAKDIREAKLGENDPATATTYNNIATVYQDMGNLGKALEFHEKAKDIRVAKLGKDHPSTATTYNNIATVYKAKGNLDKAQEFFEKAKKIREDKLGKDHPSTARTYGNMGVLYYAKEDYQEARDRFLQALRIFLQKLAFGHPDVVSAMVWLSACHEAGGNAQETFLPWLMEQLNEEEQNLLLAYLQENPD